MSEIFPNLTNTRLDRTRHIGSKGIRVEKDTSGGVLLEQLLSNNNINTISGIARVFTREHVEKGECANDNYKVYKGFGDVRFKSNPIDTDVMHECLAYILTFNTTVNNTESRNNSETPLDGVRLQSGQRGDRNSRSFHTNRVLNNFSNNLTRNVKLKFIVEDDDGSDRLLSLNEIQDLLKLFKGKGKH